MTMLKTAASDTNILLEKKNRTIFTFPTGLPENLCLQHLPHLRKCSVSKLSRVI